MEPVMPWKRKVFLFSVALLLGLAGTSSVRADDELASTDEQILKAAKVGTEPDELAVFLRKQVLPEQERRQAETLVRLLGDELFTVREDAADRLVALGSPVVPLLREAARSSNREVAERAQQCLAEINGG